MGLGQRFSGRPGGLKKGLPKTTHKGYNPPMTPLRKGKENIYDAFREKGSSILTGLACTAYFFLLFTGNLGPLAQILPKLPLNIFILIAGLVLVGQCLMWKILRMFQGIFDLLSLLLFFCEFMISLFVILFLSWPVCLAVNYIYDLFHKVY